MEVLTTFSPTRKLAALFYRPFRCLIASDSFVSSSQTFIQTNKSLVYLSQIHEKNEKIHESTHVAALKVDTSVSCDGGGVKVAAPTRLHAHIDKVALCAPVASSRNSLMCHRPWDHWPTLAFHVK